MINIHFDKTSASFAFIVGIVVGFFVRPYVMDIFNNELISENQALKDKIAQLEQGFSNKEITLISCEKIDSLNVTCKFISNKDYDYLTIYAYASVLKAGNNVVGYADDVEASDVSVVKTEEGNVSSWKFSTTEFVVNFQVSEEMINASVELFVKFDQETATTVRFMIE